MSEIRMIFGREVTVDTVKGDVIAIGDGYTVTVQVVLDGGDVLVAHTVARARATMQEATDELLPEAVAATSAWILEHSDAATAVAP